MLAIGPLTGLALFIFRLCTGNHPSVTFGDSANSAPSPLSLRDISPPRGESPSRQANAYLQIDTKITKTSLTKSRNGHCARRRVSEANQDFNPDS